MILEQGVKTGDRKGNPNNTTPMPITITTITMMKTKERTAMMKTLLKTVCWFLMRNSQACGCQAAYFTCTLTEGSIGTCMHACMHAYNTYTHTIHTIHTYIHT